MNLQTAMKTFQYAERAKSELMISSQLVIALTGFSDQEQAGGKRMLLLLMEAVRSDLQMARNASEESGFQRAAEMLGQAIGMTESMELGAASQKIGGAVAEVTTIAAHAWEILETHEVL